MTNEDWTWYQKEMQKQYQRMQEQFEKDFANTHKAFTQDLIPKNETKDKGTMRNINNYRMKLWSEVLIEVIKNNQTKPTPTEVADKALQEFDKRFNQ